MTTPRKRVYTAYDRAYQARPDQVKKREARNLARAHMEKKLGAAALKGKDIDHKVPLSKGGSNSPGNWRVRSTSSNRSDKSMMRKKTK